MDLEQLIKRLDWLEEERRKDKLLIATLQERIADLEEGYPRSLQQLTALEGELARLSANLSRFDQIETSIAQVRVELTRMIQDLEKQRAERDREADRIRLADLEALNKAIAEVRKSLEVIPELRKGLQARIEEEGRLSRMVDALEQRIEQYQRTDEEFRRQQKLLEDNQRQDAKRVIDLQGEVAAIRKRLDEQRGKMDVIGDVQRKLEAKINELIAAENERKQSQIAFMDKQNMLAFERERTWQEWQTRFEEMEATAANLDAQIQTLEATHRAIKHAQEAFEDITARFERRINEITEMQRLVEDRFRQEWASFKADDQKRWANYLLVQEEQNRDLIRQINQLNERLTTLEDLVQELQDSLSLFTEEAHKRLQKLLAFSRDLLETYEQLLAQNP